MRAGLSGLAFVLTVAVGGGAARANVAPDGLVLVGSTLAENRPAGTAVGTLTALDADAGDAHTYLLVENPGDWFALDPTTGALTATASLDYEVASQRSIRVRATDSGGLWIERSFTISIVDQNDAPTGASLSVAGVPEDAALDALVGTFHAVGDEDRSDSWTYTLLESGDGRFAVEGDRLRVAAPLDHETSDTAVLEVLVTDLAGATATTTIVLDIWDRNEPPLGVALDGAPIPENAAPGTLAGQLRAVADPDVGDAWTFALRSTATPFTISGSDLVTLASFDFEKQSSYLVPIRVTDRGGKSVDGELRVFVADVEESPTGITLVGGGVAENAPPGAIAGTLKATDPDAGDTHDFALVAGDGFELADSTLVTTMTFDHEATATRVVTVMATDAAGRSVTADVQVPIRDVNEAPTAIALTNTSIKENSPQNALVGFLSLTDPDVGDTATFVLAGDADGAFRLDGAALRVSANLDFEATPARTIKVHAVDGGGNAIDRDVVITVSDVDESASAVGIDGTSVRENEPAGTLVGHLSPSGDPDTTTGYSYLLVQNPGSHLVVDGDALRTTGPLDYESLRQIFARVRATSPAGVSVEAQVTIDVLDEPEPPTGVVVSGAVVQEGRDPGAFVATLFAQGDPDQNDRHVFTLVDNPDNAFAISGSTLNVAKVLDYESRDTYPLTLRATDTAGLWVEVPVEVHVLDVNEAPTGVDLTPRTIAEDAVVPAVVGTLSAVGDPDAGDRFTFALSQNPDDRFDVIGNQLLLRKAVDFEAAVNSYRVQVRVRDAGNLTAETAFYVSVTNVNEAPAALTLTGRTVVEDAPAGTVIGVIGGGADPDLGDAGELAIVDDQAHAFAIDADHRLVTTRPLDHEGEPTVAVTVRKTDTGNLASESTWVISVSDIDEPPTGIALDVSTIGETAPVGTVVGVLSALGDPDAGDHHTFAISADPDGLFALDGAALVLAEPLDFETASTHAVWVIATDVAGLTVEVELIVTVLDDNDAPTATAASASLPDVVEDDLAPEGMPLSELFTALGVSDPDRGATVVLKVASVDDAGGTWLAGDTAVAVGDALAADAMALRFVPKPDFYGHATLGVVADDGALASEPLTIEVAVTPVDDPPTVDAPELVEGWENAPVAIAIAVADVDAETVAVTLTGSHLIVPPELRAVTGTIAEVADALRDLALRPELGFVGEAKLTIEVDDLGGTGEGGPRVATAVVRADIAAAADLKLTRDGRELVPGDDEPLGTLGVGAWATIWLDLENRGSQDLIFTAQPVVTGAAVVVVPASRLAPGEATRLALALRPTDVGPVSSWLRLATNDKDPASYEVFFSGSAVTVGDLHVSDLGREVWNGLPHEVADMRPGRPTKVELTLENRGGARLELISVDIGDAVNAEVDVKDPFPIIDPDEPGTLEIYLTPTTVGGVSAEVVLATDDPDAETFVIALTGAATGQGAPRPVLERLPGTLLGDGARDDVGQVESGLEAQIGYRLVNLGQVAFDPTGLTATAGANVEAHVVGDLPDLLAAGESAEVVVFATALAAGSFDFELAVADAHWTVAGTADAPELPPLRLRRMGDPEPLVDTADVGPIAVADPRVFGFVIENATAEPRTLALPVVTANESGVDAIAAPQPEPDLEPFGGVVLPLALTARVPGPVGVDLRWTPSDVVRVTSPGQVGRVVFTNADGAPIDGDTMRLPLLKVGRLVDLTVQVMNGGKGPLTILGVALEGGSACPSVEPPAVTALDPAQAVPVVIHLDPQKGPFTCSLVVTSDAESEPTATLTLVARGAASGDEGCAAGPDVPLALALAAIALVVIVRPRARRAG